MKVDPSRSQLKRTLNNRKEMKNHRDALAAGRIGSELVNSVYTGPDFPPDYGQKLPREPIAAASPFMQG